MLGKRQDFDAGVIKPDVAFLNMVEGKLIVTDACSAGGVAPPIFCHQNVDCSGDNENYFYLWIDCLKMSYLSERYESDTKFSLFRSNANIHLFGDFE